MSSIFKRLERLAKSVIADFDKEVDSDYQNAWKELNSFLDNASEDENRSYEHYSSNYSPLPLTRDYINLESDQNMSDLEIKKNYKRLLSQYHPDKFVNDSEKHTIATEITIKLNESYDRIMKLRRESKK